MVKAYFKKPLFAELRCNVHEALVVTNKEFLFKIIEESNEVNHGDTATTYIMEPVGRNTAAAIAAAVLQTIKTHGEDAMMLVLAADHLILDQDAFQVQLLMRLP